jgi:hypothetical protein
MIPLALLIVGFILTVVELARSRGDAILAWAVLAVAASLLYGRL